MSARRCAVLGCETTNGRMFTFPQRAADEDRLRRWISAAGNPNLLTLPKNKLRNKTVCWKHFEARYFLQHKLCNTAVPTQYLPEPEEKS